MTVDSDIWLKNCLPDSPRNWKYYFCVAPRVHNVWTNLYRIFLNYFRLVGVVFGAFSNGTVDVVAKTFFDEGLDEYLVVNSMWWLDPNCILQGYNRVVYCNVTKYKVLFFSFRIPWNVK